MTSHVGRLYSLAIALLVFFVLWAGIAARPWASPGTDPRLAALVVREQQLRHDSMLVRKIVAARQVAYKAQLAQRRSAIAAQQRQIQANAAAAVTAASYVPTSSPVSVSASAVAPAAAPAPAVRVVNLPPLVITRTS